MKQVLLILIGGLVLSGCFLVGRDYLPQNSMMDQGAGWFTNREFASNGEQIYFTAINDRGQRIRYSGGQNFGGMMMSTSTNLGCASCHGSDGQGGIHPMHMDVMDAPDIRYKALASEEDEHGGEESHGDEHGGYDLEDFRLAVVEGAHPDGEPLSREMLRWKMDDRDTSDLFEFLKTLQ